MSIDFHFLSRKLNTTSFVTQRKSSHLRNVCGFSANKETKTKQKHNKKDEKETCKDISPLVIPFEALCM